jgi:hypothetical protein
VFLSLCVKRRTRITSTASDDTPTWAPPLPLPLPPLPDRRLLLHREEHNGHAVSEWLRHRFLLIRMHTVMHGRFSVVRVLHSVRHRLSVLRHTRPGDE